MIPRLVLATVASIILFAAAPAQASWVLKPIDGYGCPSGHHLEMVRSGIAPVDICVPDEEVLPSAADAQAPDEEQTAQEMPEAEALDTEQM